MRFVFTLAFLSAAMSVGLAQENQFGVAGGFGFYRDATLTNSSGNARAGFGPRFAASAVISRKFRNHLGANLRYTFQDGDSELRSGSVEANVGAHRSPRLRHTISRSAFSRGAGRQGQRMASRLRSPHRHQPSFLSLEHMTRSLFCALFLLTSRINFAPRLRPQISVPVTGLVEDENRQPVPGVQVSLRSETQTERTSTNELGRFRFEAIAPGGN